METTHSKIGRTKKPAPKIVINEWDDVWRSFKESNKKTTLEAMNAAGWKTTYQAAKETGLSRERISWLANNGKMEHTKEKVFYRGVTREMTFVRPKV